MTSNSKTQILVLLIILVSVVATEAQKPSSDDDGYAWEGNSNTNVSPSMAIIVIVLVLGFFITGCVFIFIQHRSSIIATTTTTGITANSAIRGLDQLLIDTLPEFQYSAVKELKLGKGALECAVCLSEFQDEETLRFLPKCDHVFHSECIDTWLAGHHTCPVCRDDLAVIPTAADKPHEPALPISTNDVQIAIPAEDETTRIQNKKGRLPRSHSTGHSLIQPGENCERFTLRLPADVRRQLLDRAKLRATSLVVLPRQTSSRRGYRGGDGEGSGNGRYSRFFGRSFIMRMGSFRTTAKVGMDGDLTSVVKPTDQTLPV